MHNLTSEYVAPLREQEAFRVMFDQAGFGVAQVSVQGEWLAVNQALCDILGYSREALLSKTPQEITRFDDVQREITNCRRILAGEVPSFSVHKRHLRGDGRVAWLKVTVTLIRDNLTGSNSYLAIIEDLTSQRKLVQQVMIEGDRRFRILADNISDVFFTLDHDLTCTYWNKAAESLTGFPFEEALGKGINEIFSHGDDVPSPEETYREVLTIQQARSFTTPCAIGSKDFLFDITAFPAREGLYVVARDIAGRQKAQEALQRLAAIVQFNDDAILSVTRDNRISSWNRGAEKLYGYSEAEILERDFCCLAPPTGREEAETLCRRALEGTSVVGYETTHRRKDGTHVSVAVSMSPIQDEKGSIVAISLIARDITKRRLIEAALKRQVAFDELMTGVLTRFTTRAASEVDDSVIYALRQTAEFIGVDHAYVIVFSADRTTWSATHEWCADGVERQYGYYQKVPVGSVPWSESKILGGEVIRIDHMRDYPPEAKEERQLGDVLDGMQSILLVPIRGAAGIIAGAVGFDSYAQPIVWSDEHVSHCKMVGDAIATVLERKRAEAALRNSQEKFSKAFEASPAIISIIRISDRRYLEVNHAFEHHTGFLRTEVLGRSITEVGRWAELQSLRYAFETVVAQGRVRNMEARFHTKNKESLTVLLSAEIIEFDGQSCVLTVAEDITERKQAEDALRESEQRFRIMADTAPIMMWMAGADKGYSDFNRGWLQFTGRTSEQESGDGWLDGVHPADRQKCMTTHHAAFDHRRPFTVEYRLRRHDGEYRWVADTGVPRLLPDGSFVGYIGCCVDVDDQKQAELARTDLSRRLMTAQEAERTRIARELHDGIGQSLALLGIQMQRAGQPARAGGGQKNPGMAELSAKLKEIGTQVSRLSHQLHSSELEFLGLAVAVKSLCREFSEQYGIKVECACKDIPQELDNDIALCFLRVVQEALHNVAKHSRASAVIVQMMAASDELILNISDNGVGFEMHDMRKSAGLGMVSMRERMHLIGGEFVIVSKPGSGTAIQARAPLPESDEVTD